MNILDLLTKRPHEWSPELRDFYRKAIVAEGVARRGRRLTEEELRAAVQSIVNEARARRGYALTDEERERRTREALEASRREPPLYIRLARASGYRYEPPARGAFLLRESRPDEPPQDQVLRRLEQCERELAELRERAAVRVELEAEHDRVQLAFEDDSVLRERLDALARRLDGLAATVERLDLRVLALENRVRATERHVGIG